MMADRNDYRITVYGHAWAQTLLRRAVQQNTTHHAYLLLGPEHIGKTTLARAFAQALTCEHPRAQQGLGACGQCRACRLAAEGGHPDHRFFAPAGKQLVIEQIREVVREAARSPIESRFKVFIITDFERATVNAANALLKTLEEPSATTRIILVSHQPSGLLDTIISRCQVLRLRPLSETSMVQALQTEMSVDEVAALRLARLTNGRLGTALTMSQDPHVWQSYHDRITEMLSLLNASPAERIAMARRLEKEKTLDTRLQEWLLWWRDVLVLQKGAEALILNQEYHEQLSALATTIPENQVRRFIQALMDTVTYLRKNVNRQLALEVLLLKAPQSG